MSDSEALVEGAEAVAGRTLSKEEIRAEKQRVIDEQIALGRAQVTGWVPKELVKPARAILAALLAGDTGYLPATVAEREAQLRTLPGTLADLAEARLGLDTAEREAAELRQVTATAKEQARLALESAQREAAHHRDDAAAAHAEVEHLQRALAEAQRQRALGEQHLSEATAALVEAQAVMQRLGQPGLRASLARRLLP
jgi:chromosome segregation ATPase